MFQLEDEEKCPPCPGRMNNTGQGPEMGECLTCLQNHSFMVVIHVHGLLSPGT
jgi:hypothetical protein